MTDSPKLLQISVAGVDLKHRPLGYEPEQTNDRLPLNDLAVCCCTLFHPTSPYSVPRLFHDLFQDFLKFFLEVFLFSASYRVEAMFRIGFSDSRLTPVTFSPQFLGVQALRNHLTNGCNGILSEMGIFQQSPADGDGLTLFFRPTARGFRLLTT